MKKTLLSAMMLCTLGLSGCGDDTTDPPVTQPKLDSQSNILAFLEGKTLVMEGDNIPSHPLSLDEDINWGSASQCFQKVTIGVGGNNFHVNSVPGTIRESSGVGQPGSTCDHAAAQNALVFDSKAVTLSNIAADGSCFEVLVDYGSFKQEGRARFSEDTKKLSMELYFEAKATGWHCADGAVGAKTVSASGQPFTGNAVQVYEISG
ncbi:hypothetical protein D7Y13_26650 [Corallococcus praedator]|uniref:Lipoprotein n=1 Tax=Corallococcus praedator TaxID=2316724 RepID=A0ABX9QCV1_9BACT|nr:MULTISPECIES: hypothetical protein [Corallococcus]RKH30286.1 hypothetical protein D7X75_21385 [Corallococcus sp. CA031C]RKI00662.1 hypothetical protein D7Y13_26650 [Corallococcus praedator]